VALIVRKRKHELAGKEISLQFVPVLDSTREKNIYLAKSSLCVTLISIQNSRLSALATEIKNDKDRQKYEEFFYLNCEERETPQKHVCR
jgi:hypothetical protein